MDSLGIYISVPFCRSKCTYCNFASGVSSPALYGQYVARVCADIRGARARLRGWSALVPERVDTIYMGGGTPSVLPPALLRELYGVLRREFDVAKDAEITLECAPGQLEDAALEAMMECGVNRVSFGVQSWIDREAAVTGRLHTRSIALRDLERVRSAGPADVSVDLIAGLPHQTCGSWRESLQTLVETGVAHASIYMLEVDEESRLGRELMAGGSRYHAHAVPDEDLTADFYETAISYLAEHGLEQYEISNFARPGSVSRHNLKYWRRRPYLGFGLDAHSMLRTRAGAALRWQSGAELEGYLQAPEEVERRILSRTEEMEEAWFLGLRLRRGVDWQDLAREFGWAGLRRFQPVVHELCELGLLVDDGETVRLTRPGTLLSNEVFVRFMDVGESPSAAARLEGDVDSEFLRRGEGTSGD